MKKGVPGKILSEESYSKRAAGFALRH